MQLDLKAVGVEIGALIAEIVAPLVKRIEELEARKPERGEKGEPGIAGQDAAQVDVAEVVKAMLGADALRTLVGMETAAYLQENPPAAGKDGRDGEKGAQGDAGERGADGKDGAGVADLLIDRDGGLVATMTDGRTKSLGLVIGKDGAAGTDGKDGADFTHVEIEYDGERTIIVRGTDGEIRKTVPVPLDRGYWREGMESKQADIVTHDGNAWIALRDTKAKPDHSNKEDWRLFARRGRDGRDAK